MPLRGALFREIQSLRRKRQVAEKKKFKQGVKKEAALLKKLRTQRIQSEGRALLKRQIASEKARISKAKKPSSITKLEGFLLKQAKKQVKKRRIRIEFNPTGKKRRKKRKKR